MISSISLPFYTQPTPYEMTGKDKDRAIKDVMDYHLLRLLSMFKYEGLPDTIDTTNLEMTALIAGSGACVKQGDKHYFSYGAWGGNNIHDANAYNVNNMPTSFIISNPYIKLDKQNFDIYYPGDEITDNTCVVLKNDKMYKGLYQLLRKYATLLVENEITMLRANINTRVFNHIIAGDDTARASAQLYMKQVEAGEAAILGDNNFLENISVQPNGTTSNRFTELIEYEQYLKACFYNDIGLQSNYNMKRESINSNEAQLDEDALNPLIDDMLACRKQFCEELNTVFGLNVSVEFNSSWEDNQIQLEAELDNIQSPTTDTGFSTPLPVSDVEDNTGADETSDLPDTNNSLNNADTPENNDTSDVTAPDIVEKAVEIVETIEDIVEEVISDDNTEEEPEEDETHADN